ncbi:unnamed protein product [Calicophoron daubneyi]|uniref:PDZ domain-containing protein n=1 Tax=Calicophoron daubneyi TaxID=300641 RepID=A0AAV2T4U4_CALDB
MEGQSLFGRVTVEIVKGDEVSLGLTISGGTDQGEPPTVASIRPGSVADRSDCLLVDDRILAINDIMTSKLRHDENVRLAKSAGPWIRMEIEYELPDLPPAGCTVKHMMVELETRGESVGLVIRGGWNRLASHIRPLIVMHVRENSLADCDGRIKPGDRILAINNIQTGQLTCDEATKLLSASKNGLNLIVEYNVANFETDRSVSGAVMVEIEKPGNEDLGISLAPCHEVKTGQNAFFINFIRQGSIADRCGALFTGDRVEAIDDIHVEDLSLQEAMLRLKHNGLDSVRLQIVPNAIPDPERQARGSAARTKDTTRSQQWPSSNPSRSRSRSRTQNVTQPVMAAECVCDSTSAFTPEASMEKQRLEPASHMLGQWNTEMKQSLAKSLTSLHSLGPPRPEVCRCEEVEVSLEPDESNTYGFSLCSSSRVSSTSVQLVTFPLIERIQPGSSAYRCGVIQEGDRVITMNGQTTLNRTIEELTYEYLQPETSSRNKTAPCLTLVTQYSVADTVIPTAGVFDVKLVRRAANLGINLQASINKQDGQPLLISKVIPGSVASRSGSISPGDILLAVNGVHLSSCSLSEAIRLLQSPSEEIVTLKIEKIAASPNPSSDEMANLNTTQQYECPNTYGRSGSVPESEINRTGENSSALSKPDLDEMTARSVESRKASGRIAAPDDFSKLLASEDTSVLSKASSSSRVTSQRPPMPNPSESAVHTDRSTSSGQEENRVRSSRSSDRSVSKPMVGEKSGPAYQEQIGRKKYYATAAVGTETTNIRSKLFSSPEDLSQDEGVSVVRVSLRRKSAECPWGIIICGTDEASNAPVFIDSLNPGDPGAESGLLFSGDRILAINGSPLHAGHTLTQAMRMLQRYPDRVTLHVARANTAVEKIGRSLQSAPDVRGREPESGSQRATGVENSPQLMGQKSSMTRNLCLKKVSAMSNFSRSFDSITNSIGSGTQNMAFSESLPPGIGDGALITTSATAESYGTQSRPTNSVRNSQSAGATFGYTTPKTRSGRGGKQDFDNAGLPGPSKSEENLRERSVDTVSLSSRGTVKPKPVAQQPPSEQSSTQSEREQSLAGTQIGLQSRSLPTQTEQMLANWTLTENFQYSESSEQGDEMHQTILHQTDYYPNFANFTELDLESIQCSGCREAIINEIRQQRRYLKQQQQRKQRQMKRRARSQQRSFEHAVDQASGRLPREIHRHGSSLMKRPDFLQPRGSDVPRATFYCAEQDLCTSSLPNPITRHSKSDSRLNLSGTCGAVRDDAINLPEPRIPYRAFPAPAYPEQMENMTRHGVPSKDRQTFTKEQGTAEGYSITPREIAGDRFVATSSDFNQTFVNPLMSQQTTPKSEGRTKEHQVFKSHQPISSDFGGVDQAHTLERGVWCTWIRLTKATPTDSYGIGVSEGLSTRGIFVSAIRPNSSADRSGQLHLYDRILMVNEIEVEGLSCSEVVGLISRSEKFLDLLIQRRISRTKDNSRDPRSAKGSKSPGQDGSARKKHSKRPNHSNLTLL